MGGNPRATVREFWSIGTDPIQSPGQLGRRWAGFWQIQHRNPETLLKHHDSRIGCRQIPDHWVPFASAADVRRQVNQLGLTLGDWATNARTQSGRQPLALCVLRGGVFFFSDLLLACPVTVEPAFCRCRSYEANQNGVVAQSVEVTLDDPGAIAGRHVLVVDDICDSGRTLNLLTQRLKELGAAEIEVAVCVHRIRSDSQFQPRWCAFSYDGPEWFAGYGMEDANHCMNFPGLYLLGTPDETD